ncbi:Hypothetical protein PHPALM_21082 [Phytophthora palmivora]|uniref:PiggyBac transposable element-derived protein domain-containing protein n=1 Tax=Phytophthora palmivora TaxID=4796 RepID=A0A2P4XD81_9STRA|nr:Hypothetical protein PHPALM_21082 [Phytophthora palmivora]
MAEPILPGTSTEAVRLCRGLAPLRHWTGDHVMHRKTSQVPATVVAYNIFMNVEKYQPDPPQGEALSMSLLTWSLDLALINAFALFKNVAGSAVERVTLREFKQRVAEKLTAVQRTRREKERCRRHLQPNEPLEDLVGADPGLYAITPNSKKYSSGKLACYLCTLRGFSKKAVYGYTGCQRGFHVACFTAFHYRDALTSNSLGVRSALDAVCAEASGDGLVHTRLKKNRTITHLSELELPKQSIIKIIVNLTVLLRCRMPFSTQCGR